MYDAPDTSFANTVTVGGKLNTASQKWDVANRLSSIGPQRVTGLQKQVSAPLQGGSGAQEVGRFENPVPPARR